MKSDISMSKKMSKKMTKKMTQTKSTVMLFTLVSLLVLLMVPGYGLQAQANHQPLEYEVSVRALLLPIFAVDADGNPVFDLKKEEIEFFVNGKPFKIAAFTAFTAEGQAGETGLTGETAKTPEAVKARKSPARINFIILDALSNTHKGVKRGKEIASGIVKKSPAQDAFVVLHAHPRLGFDYIIGPETNKEKLLTAINNISKGAGSPYWLRVGRKPRPRRTRDGGGFTAGNVGRTEFRQAIFTARQNEMDAEAKKYTKKLERFAYSLDQLKYVLKTVMQPKTIYLVSGGAPEGALGTDLIQYYGFLGKAAKSINHGGGLLYLVNPIKPYKVGMGKSLKYMADQSGGRYFAGSNMDLVVEKVKKNTSAYYELAFMPGSQTGDAMKITMKCKRKGVVLNTVRSAERGKRYINMPDTQRELFALSVVMDGSWSRILGRVGKTKIKTVKTTKSNHSKITAVKDVEITIPSSIDKQRVEAFIVNMDPNTRKAVIAKKHLPVNGILKLKVPVLKNRRQFVVLVEPQKTICVYNQVL